MAEDMDKLIDKDGKKEDKSCFPNKIILAYIAAIFLQFAQAFSLVSAQIIADSIPAFQLNALRYLAQFKIMLPVAIYTKMDITVQTQFIPSYIAVSLCVAAMTFFVYGATKYVAVGTTYSVIMGIAIFGNILWSMILKTERKLSTFVTGLASAIGLFLMIQPDFVFHNQYNELIVWTPPCGNTTTEYPPGYISPTGAIYLVLGGIILCFENYGVSHVSRVSDINKFLFWSSVFGTAFNGILMGALETVTFPLSWFCIICVLVHSFGAALSRIAISYCLQYIKPFVFIIIQCGGPVILLLFQYSFLRHIRPGHHNGTEVTGAFLCLVSSMTVPLLQIYNNRKSKEIDDDEYVFIENFE